MIHTLIISVFMGAISSLMGFTQGMLYTGKKWDNFKWNEHHVFTIERITWAFWSIYCIYLGQILTFISFVHFTIFCIGLGLAFILQYAFWQNGFLNMVYRWTKTHPYTWTSTNDPKNKQWNLTFETRLLFLFLGIVILFPLFNFTTN